MWSSFRLELRHKDNNKYACVLLAIPAFVQSLAVMSSFMVPVLTLVAFHCSALPSCVLLSTLLMFCLMPDPERRPCYLTCSVPCLHTKQFCQVLSKTIKSLGPSCRTTSVWGWEYRFFPPSEWTAASDVLKRRLVDSIIIPSPCCSCCGVAQKFSSSIIPLINKDLRKVGFFLFFFSPLPW